MTRFAAIVFLLAIAACAQPPQVTQADQNTVDAEAALGAQAYQNLQLAQFEQQMQGDNRRLTYGYAVVNCGLRDANWLQALRHVYASDYGAEFQRHPLTGPQAQAAQAYAETQISNPSPPPYICNRLASDGALVDLDNAVAVQSLVMIQRKRQAG